MSRNDLPLVDLCVGEAVDLAADTRPEAIGWVFETRRISFAAMKERVDIVARALLANGVKHGDVVAVWMPNLPEFVYIQFACAKIGAIIAALNTRAKTFEVEHHLKHSDACMLIMVEKFLKHDFASTLAGITASSLVFGRLDEPELPRLRTIVSLADRPSDSFMSWERFLADARSISREELLQVQKHRIIDEPVLMQYTSGTTSLPKGALISHRYILNAGTALLHRLGVTAGETFLNTQPFYHVGGSCCAVSPPLTLGCIVASAEYYEAERILELIEREKCVARAGYGAMYIMEMNHPDFSKYDISSLRSGWCVGTVALMERVRDEMDIPGLLQIYAATEMGATSPWVDDAWEVRSGSCGSPLSGTELKIVNPETGEDCATGEIGEICMRGWWQMIGYLKPPKETAATIDEAGWAHSGDLGYLDTAGQLRFSSRLKDMLKVGGENVAAGEVEAILLTHPKIAQAAVIGAPDERLTEVVLAVVQLRPGETLSDAEIIEFCKERMANFRVPRYVEFVSDFPLTDSGKIEKYKLHEKYNPRYATA